MSTARSGAADCNSIVESLCGFAAAHGPTTAARVHSSANCIDHFIFDCSIYHRDGWQVQLRLYGSVIKSLIDLVLHEEIRREYL